MIEIKNLTHSFGDRVLYKDVNLNINKNEKIGLVGLNGTGKTTFLDILSEKIISEKGEIIIPKNIKIGYLDQFITVFDEQTIEEYLKSAFKNLYELEKKYNLISTELENNLENQQNLLNKLDNIFQILLENDFYQIDTKINQIVNGLGIIDFGLQTKIKNLSGGQKMKVMLAKILLQSLDFLVLDEPTNYLDTKHIEWFQGYLNKFEGNLLIVSHDLNFLDSVCNTIWAIENQNIKRYNGNYSSYLKQRELNIKSEEKHNQNLLKEKQKLEEYIAKNKVRTATAKQAKSREKRLEKIEVTQTFQEEVKPEFLFNHYQNPFSNLIVIRNLAVGYEKELLKNINLTIQNGERIRLVGFNGVGKSTLLKTIFQKIPALCGTVNIYGKCPIGFYEQELNFIDKNQTPLKEMVCEFPDLTERQIRSILARTGIKAKHILEPIKNLSGGEQCRIKLAKLSVKSYSVLVLDEATNHLDVKAKKALAETINNFKGTVLFVSHEQDFADMIKNKKEIDIKDYIVR